MHRSGPCFRAYTLQPYSNAFRIGNDQCCYHLCEPATARVTYFLPLSQAHGWLKHSLTELLFQKPHCGLTNIYMQGSGLRPPAMLANILAMVPELGYFSQVELQVGTS